MDKDELKKLLEEALKPIKKTLDGHTAILNSHTKTLKSLIEKVDVLESSVVSMETTISVYGDMYKMNGDNARKLEKRIKVLEDNSGIEPPSELTLLDVQ
ncbi:MAG: hypothetical protein A2782_04065 [Candidatus Blackburnbacteria bacterium RIFCSPHIGHO2_01_FULL_43_15b]|uniref:Uncharacterized protein n=1 Tax=Candidatus Blackburnbacteria bacterium RIFCSPHIGHO2_01_FULL_43_15b TaxID=1797513 RepID=A0A1G1V3V3_9BACT|nr:MAG: hypothetical protein A2782_04065 [Candidatus Blackburnbacteria bacterium RIFCSPHIGHO2_01_FULL_43_15b]